MKYRMLIISGGLAAFGVVLAALPSPSATSSTTPQERASCASSSLQQKLENLRDLLQERLAGRREANIQLAEARALQESGRILSQRVQALQNLDDVQTPEADDISVYLADAEGGSWLGVETREVSSEKAKDLKLPAERGVVLERIVPGSPAAKAGLKENDVATEINGQRVEGVAQFRRMIREIPAGRSVQLTVWRDGRAQTLNVTLGKAEDRHGEWMKAAPGTFAFHVPEIPDTVEIPGIPEMDWGGMLFPGMRPRLGIDAEDLSGQLGAFFGVPDGEGVLVREVNPGSPAEKAGVKAGDVITKIDDERVRSIGDLHAKLAAMHDDKSLKLGILRNRSEVNLTVELPAPAPKTKRLFSHRTNI
ncbi:MAG: PDZ domain-containing protein [Candidatus Acidiferrales bacterium]